MIDEKTIEFMRADLDSGMELSWQEMELRTKVEAAVRERLKAEGKDFDVEFEKWKEANRKFEPTVSECIITEKYNCPHWVVSGKMCSSCKIPDNKESL